MTLVPSNHSEEHHAQADHVNVWVHDQDEALAFYTEKLGMEVRDDVTRAEMGNFRWLTVGAAGQSEVALALMTVPGPPRLRRGDLRPAEGRSSRRAPPAASSSRPTTAASTYEELKANGVEFTQEPTEQPVRRSTPASATRPATRSG